MYEKMVVTLLLGSALLVFVTMIGTLCRVYIKDQEEYKRRVRPNYSNLSEGEKDFIDSIENSDKCLSKLAKSILWDLAKNYGVGRVHFQECFKMPNGTKAFKHGGKTLVIKVPKLNERVVQIVVSKPGDAINDIRVTLDFNGFGYVFYKEGQRFSFIYSNSVLTRFFYNPQTPSRILSVCTVDRIRLIGRIPKSQMCECINIGY